MCSFWHCTDGMFVDVSKILSLTQLKMLFYKHQNIKYEYTILYAANCIVSLMITCLCCFLSIWIKDKRIWLKLYLQMCFWINIIFGPRTTFSSTNQTVGISLGSMSGLDGTFTKGTYNVFKLFFYCICFLVHQTHNLCVNTTILYHEPICFPLSFSICWNCIPVAWRAFH